MAFIRVLLLLGFALPACAGQNDSALLSRIDAYLNSYPRLQAQFIQTAPGGEISEGMLYLERPGKMRWEYAPPSPVLLVAEGGTATFFDRELAQTQPFFHQRPLAGSAGAKRCYAGGFISTPKHHAQSGRAIR
jgi:outer membrane lipoprotein-sorting protein